MILLFIVGVALCYFAAQYYYKKNWDQKLTVSLSFDRETMYAGEEVVLTETIENRKQMPVPTLEVSFACDISFAFADMSNARISDQIYKRDVFSVLGQQKIARRLTMVCRKRGCFDISRAELSSYGYLIHEKLMTEKQVDARICVYPRRVRVSEIIFLCEKLLGDRQCEKHLYEDPFAFAGIREYQPTDPMHRINYKVSARMGQWMVNTFESTKAGKVMLFLDLEDNVVRRQEQVLENSISIAASVAASLLRQGMEVGLWIGTQTPVVLPLAAGVHSAARIERTLAQINTIEAMSRLSQEETAVELKKMVEQTDALPCFISKNQRQNQALFLSLAKLRRIFWVQPVEFRTDGEKVIADGLTHYIWQEQ